MKSESVLIGQLQALLDQVVDETDNIHNAVMLVDMPAFTWKGASGLADPGQGIAMHVDDQFFTASVAKMMTATLAMKLVETGHIRLDDLIGQYLPESIMAALHEHDGQSYGETITLRQCLNHTTGLADNWHDDRFMELILGDPDKLWEPAETIAFVKQHVPPHFPPGQGFSYSDINYNLVGLIIEQVMGQPLHAVYRDWLLDPLGMDHTYRQFREDPRPSIPGRGPSHTFSGDVDYTGWQTLTADWAGGGLQSTADDLNRFLRAFIRNEIFSQPSTREEMFRWVETGLGDEESDVFYGLGIICVVFKEPGLGEIWGHQGASSCFMYYWPENDTTFCGTFNQNYCEGTFTEILPRLMEMLKAYQPLT